MEARLEEKKPEENISIEEFIGKQKISDETLISFIQREKSVRVEELLKNVTPSPNVNVKIEKDMTPLMLAAIFNRHVILQLLLDHGADVHALNKNNWTALHFAADSKFPNCIKPLVEAKADVNAKDKKNDTPLHNTAYIGNVGGALELLKHKADLTIKNDYGESPFVLAAMKNQTDIFKVFLNEKKNALNEKDDIDENTALHWAAKKGNPTIISLLLKEKADPEITNKKGKKPVDLASSHQSRILLEEASPACCGCFFKNKKSEKKATITSQKEISYKPIPLSITASNR